MKIPKLFALACLATALSTAAGAQAGNHRFPQVPKLNRPGTAFVRASGPKLVVGPKNVPITLRGVNANYVIVIDQNGTWKTSTWQDDGTPLTEFVLGSGAPMEWYQDQHFKLVSEVGFNVIRLNLTYRIFEDNANPGVYKQSGWDLIDKLVARAKRHHLYLILDMHVAPGGAGIIQCLGCGWRTWDIASYRNRFKALWKAIAARYAQEPTIAAFDLLNEPAPTRSVGQWKTLSQNLIREIRAVDRNHLIIVEMPKWIFDRNNHSPLTNFDMATLVQFQFLVDDDNVAYDYHFYDPTAFVLQDELGTGPTSYPSGDLETAVDGTTWPRSAAYLDHQMAVITDFWARNNVPVNFGEWGPNDTPLNQNPSLGGGTYVSDMLSSMDQRNLNWQHYYINTLWRIDCCFDQNPTTELPGAAVFRSYFAGK